MDKTTTPTSRTWKVSYRTSHSGLRTGQSLMILHTCLKLAIVSPQMTIKYAVKLSLQLKLSTWLCLNHREPYKKNLTCSLPTFLKREAMTDNWWIMKLSSTGRPLTQSTHLKTLKEALEPRGLMEAQLTTSPRYLNSQPPASTRKQGPSA